MAGIAAGYSSVHDHPVWGYGCCGTAFHPGFEPLPGGFVSTPASGRLRLFRELLFPRGQFLLPPDGDPRKENCKIYNALHIPMSNVFNGLSFSGQIRGIFLLAGVRRRGKPPAGQPGGNAALLITYILSYHMHTPRNRLPCRPGLQVIVEK